MSDTYAALSNLIRSRCDQLLTSIDRKIDAKLQADSSRIHQLGGTFVTEAVDDVVRESVSSYAAYLIETVLPAFSKLPKRNSKTTSFVKDRIAKALQDLWNKGKREIEGYGRGRVTGGTVQSDANSFRRFVLGYQAEIWARVDMMGLQARPQRAPPKHAGVFCLFFSYSCKDKRRPDFLRLARLIESKIGRNSIKIFRAEDKPKYGKPLIAKVIKELAACDAVVPFLTRNSLKSWWVHQEIGYAFCRKVPILPVFTRGTKLPAMIQFLEGCPAYYKERVNQLVDLLKAMVDRHKRQTTAIVVPVAETLQVKLIRRRWVSEGPPGLPPLHVELEFDYVSNKPDAVKSVVAEIAGIKVDADQSRGFPQFEPVSHVRRLFKFIPANYNNAMQAIPITIETSRGLSKTITIDASPGSATGTWPELKFENGHEVVRP